ncbi:hypothetical protein MMC13_004060 [Lambiella insularis]|nr:hypothetical protein [Lambiella insularis]
MRLLHFLATGLFASSTLAQRDAIDMRDSSNTHAAPNNIASSGSITNDIVIYSSGSGPQLPPLTTWAITGIVLAAAWRHNLNVQWLAYFALPALSCAEGIANSSIATIASNSTQPEPDKKGGDGGGGGGGAHGGGSDGGGSDGGGSDGGGDSGSDGGGSGANGSGSHPVVHSSVANGLLAPGRIIAGATLAIFVKQHFGLLPLALLALPALVRAEYDVKTSNVAKAANDTRYNETDTKGGRGGGGGAILANARDLIAPKKFVVSTVLAMVAHQHFGSLPLAFLLLPVLSRADATPRCEVVAAREALPSATIFVQYNLSGSPQTLTFSGVPSTTTLINGISTEVDSKIITMPVTSNPYLQTQTATYTSTYFMTIPTGTFAFTGPLSDEWGAPLLTSSTAWLATEVWSPVSIIIPTTIMEIRTLNFT